MHELSIVESLIELCEENALNNKACNVQEIY
ncbi:TPA: hydrogenase maturation nickel metallochaperone HypA, partial [Campylobacter coli]